MAKLKVKTVLLDVLVWAVPGCSVLTMAFLYPDPILFVVGAGLLLFFAVVTYFRMRG
jgi:hypothetical protein